jgi:cytoskeletal protein CcmA (bactofilin family)
VRKRLFCALGVAFLVQAGPLVAGQASATTAAVNGPFVCPGSIPAGMTIRGNVTVPSGTSCSIDGKVYGNVYAQGDAIGPSGPLSGASVSINGMVKGDVYSRGGPNIVGVAGAIVDVEGTVNGNAYGQPHAFELVVSAAGVVNGDVQGSQMNYLMVQSGGTVKGDFRAFHMTLAPSSQGNVEVNGGNVSGDVKITTSDFVIIYGSQVHGDATITNSNTVQVGSNVIHGDLVCRNNVAVSLLGSPSVVHGDNKGQCANL